MEDKFSTINDLNNDPKDKDKEKDNGTEKKSLMFNTTQKKIKDHMSVRTKGTTLLNAKVPTFAKLARFNRIKNKNLSTTKSLYSKAPDMFIDKIEDDLSE